MEQKSAYLDLTILSAADLKRNWLSGDQTVAVAWVDPLTKKTTSVASGNGSNVQWHEKLILMLNGADTSLQGKLLTVEIHARGTWGDSLLGSVYVPLVELALDGDKRGNTTLMYQIVQPSGKRQGSMKFLAKVVKPRVIGSIVPLSVSVAPLPSAPAVIPPEDNGTGLGFNALYPPVSGIRPPVETNDGRASLVAYSPYATLEVPPYPPRQHLSQNYDAEHDARQPDSPHVYPPVNMTYPPQAEHSPVNMTYPPHTSPAPNYIGIIPYSPLSQPFLETPYPPYTPPIETPYPPVSPQPPYPPIHRHSPYPPISPHPSETYPPASLYPYSNLSSPLYPSPYPQQQAAVHCPYPCYCGTRF